VGKDDIVVIYFSGHGSRMRDREEIGDKGWDETIMPCDSGRKPDPNWDITDDEIYVYLKQLAAKTPYITLIFDSCHSGTITRDAFGARSRGVERDDRPIEELPPSSVLPELAREAMDAGFSGWLPLSEQYVLIAGCKDWEKSYEIKVKGDGIYGALTFYLHRELDKAGTGTTYLDVFEPARKMVTRVRSGQHPQLEGAGNRELFGVRDIEPTRFVSVEQRAAGKVTLAAGAVHGVAKGSQWAVYPEETRRVTRETPRLGLVEIGTVGAVRSDAKIVEEIRTGAIAENARAVEEAHHYGEMRLTVDIGEAPHGYEEYATALAEVIKASMSLRQAEAGEAADVRAYILEPRTEVSEGDPVPQLEEITEATWAVVGQDGRLIMPPHRVSERRVDDIIRENLEKLVRYREILALCNPNQDSPLKGKVEFTLKRLDANGAWVTAEPEGNGGYIVFKAGERIAAKITNNSTSDIYGSILDVRSTGEVTSLYPMEGPSKKLSSGASLTLDPIYMDEKSPGGFLCAPECAPDPNDKTPTEVMETLKLFATTHEANFTCLLQGGVRDIDRRQTEGANSPLGQLMYMACTGRGSRSPRPNRISQEEEWATVERSFFVRFKMS
jgi:hypothetical protein